MAQNIALWNAQYSNVPAILLPKVGGGQARFDDTSDADAVSLDIRYPKTAYVNGVKVRGAYVPSEGFTVVLTWNGNEWSPDVDFDEIEQAYYDGTEISVVADADPEEVTVSGEYTEPQRAQPVLQAAFQYWVCEYDVVNNKITKSHYLYLQNNIVQLQTTEEFIVPTGSRNITANANNINVAQYATVNVNVPSKNSQIASGVGRVATTAYSDVGLSITVAKTGTYHVYWTGYRSSTGGTNGSELFVNDTLRGSAQTTFNGTYTNVQNVHLTGISLNKDDVVTVRARARSTSYYMYVMNLTIIEA